MTSIAASLGIGSGIDTAALVANLTAAARDPKDAALTKRETANAARISAIGQAKSAIDSFASSLTTLIAGGTLFTQPSSSDSGIVAASALPGGRLDGLAASLEVRQLAQAQTLASTTLPSGTSAVGEGTLSLTVGGTSYGIAITSANDSVAGLAAAINAVHAGVTASVVTDTTGARLVIKGATGAAAAFTLQKTAGDDAGIGRFAYGFGGAGELTRTQPAQDALLTLDGVQVTRATNSVSDLIDGVKLDLVKATPGTTVSLGFTRPTSAIKQAVGDFVSAYNQLESLLDSATAKAGTDGSGAGPLVGDASIRAVRRALGGIVATTLATGGGPGTLAEIGVKTQRDGSLALDSAALDKALADDPAGVEALFNPSQHSDNPAITVLNAAGKAKPGSYAISDVTAAAGSTAASGTIAGYSATGSGDTLTAATVSPAAGLVLKVSGAVASATVTVDLGLGGALQSIRDALEGTGGALTSAGDRFDTVTKSLATERTALDTRIAAYKAQLETSFTAMEGRLTLLKSTQSQLTSQIAQWNRTS